jgi:hypothetical protein
MPRRKSKSETSQSDSDSSISGLSGTSGGMTINLGGFQSARFDCWAALPCTVDKARDTYIKCHEFVMSKLGEESEKIYKENEEIKGRFSKEVETVSADSSGEANA